MKQISTALPSHFNCSLMGEGSIRILPGQVFDSESGLFQNHHREFQALKGGYTQVDPIGLQGGINSYAYVGSNPLGATDSTGLVYGPAIVIGAGLVSWAGYEMWHRYLELIQCKKACKEKTKDECDKGDTRSYHQCESACVLNFWFLKSKGPRGPSPEKPF